MVGPCACECIRRRVRGAMESGNYTVSMVIPHCVAGNWPEAPNERRFAAGIRRDSPEGCRVALIGLADDTGITLNGGRAGSRDGPAALRRALMRYGAREAASGAWPAVFDAGDVQPAESLNETHARVTEAVGAILDAGMFPVGIGGGHDLTFPFVRAVAARRGAMRGVYFDAHLDVRAEPGSGMAFRALVEQCGVRSLHVQGLSAVVNSAEHMLWFSGHGGKVDDLTPQGEWPDGPLFVSFDLDVVDAGSAPGVSAPNPCGWNTREAAAWARAAGRNPRVECFDLMELNPVFDAAGLTARLAAHLLLEFLAGFGERG